MCNNGFIVCIFLFFNYHVVYSQSLKTPTVEDGINWMEDDARMKKGKVKEIKEFKYYGTEKIQNAVYNFDTAGYMTDEKEFRNGAERYSRHIEYSINHNSMSRYIISYNGEKSTSLKYKCDIYGYALEILREGPDGTFVWEEKMRLTYTRKNKIETISSSPKQSKNWLIQIASGFFGNF